MAVDLEPLWLPLVPEMSRVEPEAIKAGKQAKKAFDRGASGIGDTMRTGISKAASQSRSELRTVESGFHGVRSAASGAQAEARGVASATSAAASAGSSSGGGAGRMFDTLADKAAKATDKVKQLTDATGSAVAGGAANAGSAMAGSFLSSAVPKLTEGIESGVTSGMAEAGAAGGGAFLAGAAPKILQLGSKAGPWGAAIAGVAALGLGAGALIMGQITRGMEIQSRRSVIQAQLGIDDTTMRQLGRSAGAAYTNGFGQSVEQNMDTAKAALQAGVLPDLNDTLKTQEAIEGLDTINTLMGVDAVESSRAAGQMVRTGLVTNMQEAFDIIVAGYQRGLDKSGDWLDTLNEYSTQFRQVGITGKDALGLINQMVQSGARDSDKAADALKEFAIRAVDNSVLTRSAYKELELDPDRMAKAFLEGGDAARGATNEVIEGLRGLKDEQARNAVALALFGTQYEDLGDSFNSMNLNTAAQQLGNVDGAAQRAGDTLTNGPLAAWEKLKRNVETGTQTLQMSLAQAFGPGIERAVNGILAHKPEILGFFTGVADKAIWLGSVMLREFGKITRDMGSFVGGIADTYGLITQMGAKLQRLMGRDEVADQWEREAQVAFGLGDKITSMGESMIKAADEANALRDGIRATGDQMVNAEKFTRDLGGAMMEIRGADIVITDNSPEVLDKIDKTKYELQNLPDGTVKVVPKTDEALVEMNAFRREQGKEEIKLPLKPVNKSGSEVKNVKDLFPPGFFTGSPTGIPIMAPGSDPFAIPSAGGFPGGGVPPGFPVPPGMPGGPGGSAPPGFPGGPAAGPGGTVLPPLPSVGGGGQSAGMNFALAAQGYVPGTTPNGSRPGQQTTFPASVEKWRGSVRQVLQTLGPQYGIRNIQAWENAMLRQIDTESDGNAGAFNGNDSNGQGGTQTVRGLLQFLDSTYAANNILNRPVEDPIGQIAAFLPYVTGKYGMHPDGSPKYVGEGHGYRKGLVPRFDEGGVDMSIDAIDGGWWDQRLFHTARKVMTDHKAGKNKGYAQGVRDARGMISGPGTGTSDSIFALLGAEPIRIANGESIVTAAGTRANAPWLDAINRGLKLPPLRRFEKGLTDAGGLQPYTQQLQMAIQQLFPQIATIYGYRGPDGYNEHASGRALDVMIPNYSSPAGVALGDQIAQWALSQPGVNRVMWQASVIGSDGSRKPQSNANGDPTHDHMDHVHVFTNDMGTPNAGGASMPYLTGYGPTGAYGAGGSFFGSGSPQLALGAGSGMMSAEDMERYNEEQKGRQEAVDSAVRSQRNAQEALDDANYSRDQVQDALNEARNRKDDIVKGTTAATPEEIEGLERQLQQADRAVRNATEALNDTGTALTEAQNELGKPSDVLSDMKDEKSSAEPYSNDMIKGFGSDLVGGLFEGLGFDGSIFENPTEWGIWKLFTGGVNTLFKSMNNYGEMASKGELFKGSPTPGVSMPFSDFLGAGAAGGGGGGGDLLGGIMSALPGINASPTSVTTTGVSAAQGPGAPLAPGPGGVASGIGTGPAPGPNPVIGAPVDASVTFNNPTFGPTAAQVVPQVQAAQHGAQRKYSGGAPTPP